MTFAFVYSNIDKEDKLAVVYHITIKTRFHGCRHCLVFIRLKQTLLKGTTGK